MRIDLHSHSRVSDGTDSPAELVTHAAEAGLDVVALTDHDTFDGLDEAVATGDAIGVRVIRGMELSCSHGGESVHLLAYGADPEAPGLAAEMAAVRGGRTGRLTPVLAKLAALGYPLTEADVMVHVGSSPSVGRPHIADAMIDAGYVKDRKEAFDRFLADGGPAHVARYAIELERGIDLVHAAGGVAVIAHPWGRGREHVLPVEFVELLVAQHQLDGFEVDHHDHDAQVRRNLKALGSRLGVLMTGSSDYHGTGKVDHDLGSNTTSPEMFDRLEELMQRRAAQEA